ncbi:MAG: FAD-dependent oxidoreductase [Synergistaceae bacterium]|jgi:NADPH-dependent 2,4-dienoyl-CoA reductase/sulfur reductase-like enzyme/rhodanese-related sulfurtransferase|nr:FAD-dependent oxidoreductase [Synergistaceae bacterium]
MKVVIIGGVACGAKTAARLSRVCPEAEITLLERGSDLSYANCGFPFHIGGEVRDRTGLTHMGFGPARDVEYFERYAFTNALTGHVVTSIDRKKKQVAVRVVADGTTKVLPWDKLVIATGASPIRLDVPGMGARGGLGNVFNLWTLRDTIAICEALEREKPKKAVVVGAGLVGVETAEALRGRGLDVTLIDALPHPLAALVGTEFGTMLRTQLAKNGVSFYGGERLTALEGGERARKVVTDKRAIEADIVIVAAGVRPNIELARDAKLRIGTRAIRVDRFMRTSDPDIYAGGDCVESRNILTGKPVWQPMGSTANRHGRVIADHIAGLARPGARGTFTGSTFTGVEGTAIARVFDWSVGKTGLTSEAAREAGFAPVEVLASNPDLPGFMPGVATFFIRLVADASTRRVLGAQMTGPGRLDKRLDVIATAIMGKLTVDHLADVDLAYAPPFSSALDPVTHAANALRNKMEGLMPGYSPVELRAKAERGDDFVILDVRGEKELERFGKLSFDKNNKTNKSISAKAPRKFRHIPLGELKDRVAELPRDREIIVVCRAGVRAWSACSMLRRCGYTKFAVLEGGMAAWPYEVVPHP